MAFPIQRNRRLRQTEAMRSLVRETHLSPDMFVLPLFVCPGKGVRREIASMPGVFQLSVDEAAKAAQEAESAGLGGVILFGLPEKKDEQASGAYAQDGIVQRALRAVKSSTRKLVVIGDVCLCEYTSHGHCGVVKKSSPNASSSSTDKGAAAARAAQPTADFEVENDATLKLLARAAVSQAQAGADVIAPSDMMDGRVAAIRAALDEAGLHNTPILSYAAKFASAFYGPFREAADSAPQFGDRRSYQMDSANIREAMREITADVEEGADMIMVKPAMPYLDVLAAARQRFDLPLAAYQVSGEYAMLQAACARGWLERERSILESLLSIRRAGADFILTYFALEAAKLLS